MVTENIIYFIKETDNDTIDNITVDDFVNDYALDMDGLLASQINYADNYTVKDLCLIMDYYQLNKRKLKKGDLVEKITDYELNPENMGHFQERIRLWENFNELKQHSFFKKYILFNA